MSFKNKIPACFGCADKNFAGHTSDAAGAREMLINALSETNSWSDFINNIQDYLRSQGCNKEHIDIQIERVRNLANYFTED